MEQELQEFRAEVERLLQVLDAAYGDWFQHKAKTPQDLGSPEYQRWKIQTLWFELRVKEVEHRLESWRRRMSLLLVQAARERFERAGHSATQAVVDEWFREFYRLSREWEDMVTQRVESARARLHPPEQVVHQEQTHRRHMRL